MYKARSLCWAILMLFTVCLFGLTSIEINAQTLKTEIGVMLDGNQLIFDDQKPFIMNNRVLVPIRKIVETLGGTVEWEASTGVVIVKKGDANIRMTIGELNAIKNNETVKLEVTAQLANGRTMIPLRFVSEALGMKVEWDGKNGVVYLSTQEGIANSSLMIPSILSDNMLLQQKKPIKVWGKAAANTEISIELANNVNQETIRKGKAISDNGGNWLVKLEALDASFDEYTMTIKGGTEVKTIRHILVGEVWLSSGQSNMELQVQYSAEREYMMKTATNQNIRIFYQKDPGSTGDYPYTPVFDVMSGNWKLGNSGGNVAECPAVGYSFIRKLYEQLNEGKQVPVGILVTGKGSSSISAWISREKIESTPVLKAGKGYVTKDQWNTSKNNFNQMSALYNQKIAPLGNFSIKGFVWYQGENNVGATAGPYMRIALKALAEDWSATFGSPERLPFLYVLLTSRYYDAQRKTGYESTALPMTIEGMIEAYEDMRISQDNVAIVPTYDLDPLWEQPENVFQYQSPSHPLTKKPVGERLALAAKGAAYGSREKEYLAPMYKSVEKVGNRLIFTFDHVGEGLEIRDGDSQLRGFSICGADKIYIEAEAKITDKNRVEVWNDSVKEPVAATYAFTAMNRAANLTNSIDLPAIPFRTDKTTPRRTSSSEAGTWFNIFQEWMWCDAIQFWANTDFLHASMHNTWAEGSIMPMGSVKIDADQVIKNEGNASFKVNYETLDGKVGFGPVTDYVSLLIQNRDYEQYMPLAAYDIISFDLYNDDAREKAVEIMIADENNQTYFLSSVFGGKTVAIPAKEGWSTFTFNLKSIIKNEATGRVVVGDEALSIIGKAKKLQFVVVDKAQKGSVHIDHVQFSF